MIHPGDLPFIRRQRAKGFSWAAIAIQLGCNEIDLRTVAESGAPKAAPPRPKKPRAESVTELTRPRRDARVFAKIVAADGRWLNSAEIGGQDGQNAVSSLRRKHGAGIIQTGLFVGYRITPLGREVWRIFFAEHHQDAEESAA